MKTAMKITAINYVDETVTIEFINTEGENTERTVAIGDLLVQDVAQWTEIEKA